MVVSTDVTVTTIQATGKQVADATAIFLSDDAYARIPDGALFAQQGDIYLRKLAAIPKGSTQMTAHRQLVVGESLGSRHCLDSLDGVRMYTVPSPTVLDGPVIALTQARDICHPKHGDLCGIPAGSVFQVVYQRAYGDELRRVAD